MRITQCCSRQPSSSPLKFLSCFPHSLCFFLLFSVFVATGAASPVPETKSSSCPNPNMAANLTKQLEGSRIPSLIFRALNAEKKFSDLSTETLFKGKKVVLFAVPGAFTSTCSRQHLPDYVTADLKRTLAAKVDDVGDFLCTRFSVRLMTAPRQQYGGELQSGINLIQD